MAGYVLPGSAPPRGSPIVDVYAACEWTAVGLLSEISVVNGGRTMEVPKFRKGMAIEEKGIKL